MVKFLENLVLIWPLWKDIFKMSVKRLENHCFSKVTNLEQNNHNFWKTAIFKPFYRKK